MDVHGKEANEQLAAVRSELHETKKELLAKADEILRKLGKVNLGGRRNSRHTEAQKKVCLACWMSAQNNTELKDGTARGIATYKAAFNWYRSQLALVGVADFRKFLDVLNAIKTKRSADRKAALEAKLDGRKNPAQTSTKHGKIGGMKGDRMSREQSKRTISCPPECVARRRIVLRSCLHEGG